MNKNEVYDKFAQWINQRPDLDWYNYQDRSLMNAECRRIAKQKDDAFKALNLFFMLPYSEEILRDSMRAFSGRLSFDANDNLQYVTGQYWPTEYRLAACAVLEQYIFESCRTNRKACLKLISEHCTSKRQFKNWLKLALSVAKKLHTIRNGGMNQANYEAFYEEKSKQYKVIDKKAKSDMLASAVISLANAYVDINTLMF